MNMLTKIPDFAYNILIQTGYSYICWVGKTTRWLLSGEEHYLEARCREKPIIFAFWHNQLGMMGFFYSALTGRDKISALVSRSRDGQVVSDFIEKFGYAPVRGSSSRGGPFALLQMTRKIKQGYDLVITPDGPRGPRHQAQVGVVTLASVTGSPILPVAYTCRSKKILKTWDRFIIPSPYNIGVLQVGSPLHVDHHADDSHLQAKRNELQRSLDDVNYRAAELLTSVLGG